MKLKTFKEIRTTVQVYPDIDIFEADKQAINSWFDTRYVVDNEKFVTFFQRVLTRDYGRYRELLRIEPHISKFDWLVQQYNESQTYEKGVDSSTSNGTTTENRNTTNNSTGSTSATDTTVSNGSDTRTHNGTDTDNKTGSRNTVNGGTDLTEHSSSDNSTVTTNSESGGSDTTSENVHNNVKNLTRENPMSISYGSGGASIDNKTGNTGALNWEYPSSQTEQDTRNTTERVTEYGRTDESTSVNRGSQNSTDTTTHGHSVTETFNEGGTRTTLDTDTDLRTDNTTHTNIGATDRTETGTATGSTVTGNATSTENQRLTQHINTGRSVDTATLLKQAQAYIMSSSAFAWLYAQLDTCFMGVYNDDNSYL